MGPGHEHQPHPHPARGRGRGSARAQQAQTGLEVAGLDLLQAQREDVQVTGSDPCPLCPAHTQEPGSRGRGPHPSLTLAPISGHSHITSPQRHSVRSLHWAGLRSLQMRKPRPRKGIYQGRVQGSTLPYLQHLSKVHKGWWPKARHGEACWSPRATEARPLPDSRARGNSSEAGCPQLPHPGSPDGWLHRCGCRLVLPSAAP